LGQCGHAVWVVTTGEFQASCPRACSTAAEKGVVGAHTGAAEGRNEALIEAADDVFVSVASAWETAIKVHLGKLTVDAPSAEAFFVEQMQTNAFTYLPIARAHVFRAASLPLPHGDPFDRMLIAQALVEGLSLVTRDDFRAYGLPAAW
jgi:PIN domain nuclease of toxin-antitoxin system